MPTSLVFLGSISTKQVFSNSRENEKLWFDPLYPRKEARQNSFDVLADHECAGTDWVGTVTCSVLTGEETKLCESTYLID
jgi:hypothetical protein